MRETTINIIDALRGQQEQLKRLLAQKVLISDAPRPDLSEIEAQVIEIKSLLAEFEKLIQGQLSEVNNTPRPPRRAPPLVSVALVVFGLNNSGPPFEAGCQMAQRDLRGASVSRPQHPA
jgi:hypothetical protein